MAQCPSARLLACLTCLRLASGPAQPATRHPASGPSVYETGLPSPGPSASQGMPATRPAPSSQPTSRLSPRSGRWSGPAPSAQSETGLKVCQPETSLRPSPSARLLACLTCLRLASGQPTQPQAQVCMKQALPIQQPAQAQLSPAHPAQVPGATSSVAARQPATHPWLCSLVTNTSFRPSPTSNSLPSPGPGASQGMPATQPQARPACQGQVCLTCLRLASGQRPVSRV